MKKLIATALTSLLLAACNQPAQEAPPADPKVENSRITFPPNSNQISNISSIPVEMEPVPLAQLNGRLAWNEERTVRVFTPFAGRVEKILVQPGQKVSSGQALAIIASPEFGQAQADARRAESDFLLAEKNLQRVRELEQHGVAPRKDLQTAEADASRTRAEFERARNKLKLYGASREGVDQVYTLTSPIAGTVVERNINPGQELRPDQMVANSPPLFVISDPTTLWALFDASERNLAYLHAGKNITVRTPTYRDQSFTARVEAISDFLDPGTRALKVRARIENKNYQLKAEMFVTAEVDADGERELLVPTKAVFFQTEKYYLFLDEGNGVYQRREVKTGDVRNNFVEILSGLNAGEKVVTEGTLMLQQVMQPRRVQK